MVSGKGDAAIRASVNQKNTLLSDFFKPVFAATFRLRSRTYSSLRFHIWNQIGAGFGPA
jgi:hypothetical protein